MTILEEFLEDLGGSPDNWMLRGVVADWAEDNDRPELAECLRWMVRRLKRPYHGIRGAASWFNEASVDPKHGDPESNIPAAVYQQLQNGREVAHHKTFPSVRAAEEAFYAAWTRARSRGWSPE